MTEGFAQGLYENPTIISVFTVSANDTWCNLGIFFKKRTWLSNPLTGFGVQGPQWYSKLCDFTIGRFSLPAVEDGI